MRRSKRLDYITKIERLGAENEVLLDIVSVQVEIIEALEAGREIPGPTKSHLYRLIRRFNRIIGHEPGAEAPIPTYKGGKK